MRRIRVGRGFVAGKWHREREKSSKRGSDSEVCFSFSLSIAQSLGLLEEKPKPQKLIPSKSLQSFVRLLQKVFFFPFYLLRCSFPLNSSLLLSPFSPLSNFVKLEFFVSCTFYLYFPFISSIFLVKFGLNSMSLWLLQKLGPFWGCRYPLGFNF